MEKRSTPPDEIQEVLTLPDNEKENIPSDGGSSLPTYSFKLSHPLEIVDHNKPSGILKDAKPPSTPESINILKSDENHFNQEFPQNIQLPGSLNVNDSDVGWLDEASNILHPSDTECGVISMESVVFPDALPLDDCLYDSRDVDLSVWLKDDDSDVELLDETSNILHPLDTEDGVISMESVIFPDALPLDHCLNDSREVDLSAWLEEDTVDEESAALSEEEHEFVFPEELPKMNPQNFDLPGSLKDGVLDVELLQEAQIDLPPINTADSDGPVLSMATDTLDLMEELLDEALDM